MLRILLLVLGVLGKDSYNRDFKKSRSGSSLKEETEISNNFNEFRSRDNSTRSLKFQRAQKKVVLVSKTKTGNGLSVYRIKFSIAPEPRFGIEWLNDGGLINGTSAAAVAYSIRLMGMHEVNGLSTKGSGESNDGQVYRFKRFDWSELVETQALLENTTSKVLSFSTVGKLDDLTLNLTMSVTTEQFNGTTGLYVPNGLKYTLNFTGRPNYKLQPETDSTWRVIKHTFSSHNDVSSNGVQILDGAAVLQWVPTIIVDGKETTLTSFDRTVTETVLGSPIDETMRKSSHEMEMDALCTRGVAIYSIPYFESSFFWDPTIFVDETIAEEIVGNVQSDALRSTSSYFGILTLFAAFLLW